MDIDFALRGPDLEVARPVRRAAPQRARAARRHLDPDTTLKLDKPELRVQIDRDRAADLGVDIEQMATALRLMVGGDEEVSRFRDPLVNEDYDVQLRLSEADRRDPRTIGRLFVSRASAWPPPPRGGPPGRHGPGGGLVRLDNVVTIAPAQTASRIDRSDRQRQVACAPSSPRATPWPTGIDALRQARRR